MVKSSVKKFIKKYKIKEITYPVLEQIINSLGFKIQYFNKYSKKSIALFENLCIKNPPKCFTFASEDFRYVFISDSLNNDDKIYLLLHEIGHIYLNHIEQNVILDNVKFEKQANEFAFWIEIKLKKRKVFHKIIIILLALILSLSVGVFIYNSNSTNTNSNSVILNDNNDVYYITKTGDKYHTKDCRHIAGREITAVSIDDLKAMGYEPCEDCIKEWT